MATKSRRVPNNASAADLIRQLVAQSDSGPRPLPSSSKQSEPRDLLLDNVVDGVRCLLIRTAPADHPMPKLSPREQEIVRMIAKGYPNKTIADVLEISIWTVATHLRRIFAKLHVNTRAAVVARSLPPELPPRKDNPREGPSASRVARV